MPFLWYHWIAAGSLAICLASCAFHLGRLIRLGKPVDYSTPMGRTAPSVIYSVTGAMSPEKKETAYLHLPTYAAGLVYHLGTFLSIALFILLLSGASLQTGPAQVVAGILVVSGLCGTGILVKRMVQKKLRELSNPDDYVSNFLVTCFHFISAATVLRLSAPWVYFTTASLLLLYMPLGKLRHTIYFFAARYHLGNFFGWRGVWPPRKHG
jgi:hypothetical protein